MSELVFDMFSHMEFNERIYVGQKDGYTSSVCHVTADTQINLRPLVKDVRTYEQGIVLVMQSGDAVYVAYSNIRYCYFGLCESPAKDDEPSVGSGKKEHVDPLEEKSRAIMRGMNERMFEKLNEDQGPWPGKFATPEQSPEESPTLQGPYSVPKRRGRPPKVRPEPEPG